MMKKLKQFGQHFLNDTTLAQQTVARMIADSPCKNMVEIGPGDGVLTQFLLQDKTINYKVVEIDNRLVEYLPVKFPLLVGKLIHADFLTLNLNEIFDGEPFSIVGNFPYNISSQIIFKALENQSLVPFLAGICR
jgi:16S rRNA (adenine1518-N6/adenine1519-N6)-dimethyltransferase